MNKQKDIYNSINNAFSAARYPAKLKDGITDKRAKTLGRVSQALIEPLTKILEDESTEEPLITPEETVFVLLGAALMAQTLHVMGRHKLPSVENEKTVKAIYDK